MAPNSSRQNQNLAAHTTKIVAVTSNVSNLTTQIQGGTIGIVQQGGGAPGPITVGAAKGGAIVAFTLR